MVKLVYKNDEKYIFYNGQKTEINHFELTINIDRVALEYIKFIETQSINGLVLEEFYVYDGIPLYYFERPTIVLKIKQLIFATEFIKMLLEKYKDTLQVETDNEIFSSVCKNIFKLDVISSQANSTSEIVGIKKKSKMFYESFLWIISGLKNYVLYKVTLDKRENICILTYTMNINLINKDEKKILYDTQMGTIVEKLRDTYKIFNFEFLGNRKLLEKSLKLKGNTIPFEFLLILKKLNKNRLINIKLLENNMKNLVEIDYSYNDFDFKNIILHNIFNDLKIRFDKDLNEILMLEKFFKKSKINKCIVTDEGDRARCFITAGNRNGVHTYSIQHGLITDTSPEYIFNSKYLDILIPKHTFVWGNNYKKILVDNTNIYKETNVDIVGQLRTDLLFEKYLRPKEKNGIKLKILYATQYFKDILEPATTMLFEALEKIKVEYEIIIKLHPSDHYFDFYKSMANKYSIKNFRILKDGDIYDLMNWCSVIVSVHSTVVQEGTLLNKPSICIRLPKYNDLGGFIQAGISFGVSERNELIYIFEHLDDNKGLLISKMTEYVADNFYKIDGCVALRIIERITGELEVKM